MLAIVTTSVQETDNDTCEDTTGNNSENDNEVVEVESMNDSDDSINLVAGVAVALATVNEIENEQEKKQDMYVYKQDLEPGQDQNINSIAGVTASLNSLDAGTVDLDGDTPTPVPTAIDVHTHTPKRQINDIIINGGNNLPEVSPTITTATAAATSPMSTLRTPPAQLIRSKTLSPSPTNSMSRYAIDPGEDIDFTLTTYNVRNMDSKNEIHCSNSIKICRNGINCHNIDTVQCKRKGMILSCGLLLIGVGFTILITFVSFINNDFNNKCLSPDHNFNLNSDHESDINWYENNPELLYYNQFCLDQVVSIFNEYPCNCRSLRVSGISSANITAHDSVPVLLNKFTNLEGISIEGDFSDHLEYNFTNDMLENLYHLKSLAIQYVDFEYIDGKSISKLINLEILHISYNDKEYTMPFNDISKLSQLKAFHVEDASYMTNIEIPKSFCNLEELRYFVLKFTFDLEHFPFYCIHTKMIKMQHFWLSTFPYLDDYIDPKMWKMPQLGSVVIEFTDLNQSLFTFDTFLGYSNSITDVSLDGNVKLCTSSSDFNNTIIINDVSYFGFGHLNDYLIERGLDINNGFNTDDETLGLDDNGLSLLKFIEMYDPCNSPCSASNDRVWGCPNNRWKDGRCDENCNNEFCNYDGGDCHQLCPAFSHDSNSDSETNINSQFVSNDTGFDEQTQTVTICNSSLWMNDQCDFGCNTSICGYDLYRCIYDLEMNYDTCYIAQNFIISLNTTNSTLNANQTETISVPPDSSIWTEYTNVSDTICYNEWLEDTWCDANCNRDECEFDKLDCDINACHEDGGYCGQTYKWMMSILASFSQPDELILMSDICDWYQGLDTIFGSVLDSFKNCTDFFYYLDTNNNGYVGYLEGIVGTAEYWGLDQVVQFDIKKEQIDCSFCMINSSLYRW